MTDSVLWHRSRVAVLVIVLSVAALLVYLVRHRGDSDVLPPTVVHAVDAERVARPALAESLVALRRVAETARKARAVADARAEQMQRAAAIQGRRADSLALEAKYAATARDSALTWHLAYAARTAERDTLLATIDTLRLEVTLVEAEARANGRGRDIADAARLRADSVLDATVSAAVSANCRVPLTLGLVHCMSRKKAAIAGAALALTGKAVYDAARDGRIRLPLPFHSLVRR